MRVDGAGRRGGEVKPKLVWHASTTNGNNKNNYAHAARSSTPHASTFISPPPPPPQLFFYFIISLLLSRHFLPFSYFTSALCLGLEDGLLRKRRVIRVYVYYINSSKLTYIVVKIRAQRWGQVGFLSVYVG